MRKGCASWVGPSAAYHIRNLPGNRKERTFEFDMEIASLRRAAGQV